MCILLIVAITIAMAIGICCKNCYKEYQFNRWMKTKNPPEIFVCGSCSESLSQQSKISNSLAGSSKRSKSRHQK